ncbi:MAG: glycoside hydrolase family 95 protein [Clostridiales bacterium]|nr:glycoside hydrolase family 95 protein [Clostridiales bacterium]
MKKPMKLWYQQPAGKWVEALPIGNGRIGAMVFSIPDQDVFMLNEDTLWSGYPRDTNVGNAGDYYPKAIDLVMEKGYKEAQQLIENHMLGAYTQSYMPLGDLKLDFYDIDRDEVTEYRRELNLSEALVTTEFIHKSIHYKRETFISHPDECMLIKLTASQPSSISFTASFHSKLRHRVSAQDNTITVDGICPSHVDPDYIESPNPVVYEDQDDKKGISFRKLAIIQNQGGRLVAHGQTISIENADSVIIKLCVRTSFNGFDKHPFLEGKDFIQDVERDRMRIKDQPYHLLKARHIEDYQALYNRVEFDLGEDPNYDLPTDKRLELFQEVQDDKGLYSLIFQYGRYLLIASSRQGTQPANLQGIWNHELRPPWSSNYTLNINTEMNYWPAEICNLSELHEPLFEFIKDLQVTGARTAKLHYNAGGFVAHHNSDLWRLSNPVGNFGLGTAGYAFWPMSAGWLCQHLFEHYEYSLDRGFLEATAYPAIKGAAQFYLDTLVEDKDGYLMMSPSTSPENMFLYEDQICFVSKTTTMTTAIIREVFNNYLKCCEILDIDEEMIHEVKDKLPKLFPYQIGSKGQLLEWEEEFEEADPYHRHISHIYPLHPGFDINPMDTPELAQACRQGLLLRGDKGTGWSLGWKINAWARLHDGNHALKLLKAQLAYVDESDINYVDGGGTYMNLFGAHPPFQIDGNFGAAAGIAELFLQSYDNQVLILPALPDEFINGRIRGLCAKGRIVTDIIFKDNKLEKMEFYTEAEESRKMTFIYKGKSLEIDIVKGKNYILDESMFES